MGLSLVVGVLADLNEHDPAGSEEAREYFAAVNRFLTAQSQPVHQEPSQGEVWSCGMYGYSGLHYLRRIAAHLELTGKLPPPGDKEASNDPLLRQYYANFEQARTKPAGSWFRRGPKPRSFDHLIIHSDAEGYYLPRDFREVLIPPDDSEIPGGIIGSSQRLLAETQALATALSLPLDLDPESSTVFDAVESQGRGGQFPWQSYGIESLTCLGLHQAAERSVRTGAAVVFS